MSVTVNYVDGEKVKAYTVKDYDELTLQDWRHLTIPKIPEDLKDPGDFTIEMLKRHTGIPLTKLRKLPPSEADKLLDAIGDTIAKAMNEGGKEDPDYVPPATLTTKGKTYTVPKNLEADTIFGQWVDLGTTKGMEHEADIFARFLAVLCVPEGQAYDGEKVPEIERDMLSLKMVEVFALHAFFFANSERYRNAINRAFRALSTSTLHKAQRALKITPTTTEGTSASSVPQS